MKLRRWFKRSLLLGVIVAGITTALAYHFRPAPMPRTEIFKGVFLTVENIGSNPFASGRVMIAEIHCDTPGVRLANRPFDYQFSPENPVSPHYKLRFADLALRHEAASLLVNTTLYSPHGLLDSLPGKAVRSDETLVVDGQLSHLHEHSYLIFWDKEKTGRIQTTKPPSETSLKAAVTAISIQGIGVFEGRVNPNAVDTSDVAFDRTFIGIDPTRNVLYLLAFEKATAYFAASKAVESGVVFGGFLDSGSSTNLLVGKEAAGLPAHSGIRNLRPLGAYLSVYADAL